MKRRRRGIKHSPQKRGLMTHKKTLFGGIVKKVWWCQESGRKGTFYTFCCLPFKMALKKS